MTLNKVELQIRNNPERGDSPPPANSLHDSIVFKKLFVQFLPHRMRNLGFQQIPAFLLQYLINHGKSLCNYLPSSCLCFACPCFNNFFCSFLICFFLFSICFCIFFFCFAISSGVPVKVAEKE